jgi:hypothetical protein
MCKNWFPKQCKGIERNRKPSWGRLGVEALEKREVLSGGNTGGYILNHGNLYHGPGLLDTNVKDFCVPGNIVYDLHTDGGVFQLGNGQKTQVGWNDIALVSDAAGNVFSLNYVDHGIWQHNSGASWTQVGSNDGSLVSDATGNVFALSFDDHKIYEHTEGAGYSWGNTGAYNIASLVSDATGNVFVLSFGNNQVYEHDRGTLTAWSYAGAYNIASLVSDATGNVFALSFGDGHKVFEHNQSTDPSHQSWSEAGAYNIVSLVSDASGDVFVLNSDSQIWIHNQGTMWTSVAGNVASLTVMPNGTLLALGQDRMLYYSETGQQGTWQPLLGSLSATAWTLNQPGYAGTIAISAGTPGSNLMVTGLPSGLGFSLSGSSITLAGTPTQSGVFDIVVSVPDVTGAKVSQTFSLTINPPPRLGSLSDTLWHPNEPGYSGSIAVFGGTPGYSHMSVTGLPAGLSATLWGQTVSISGTPTQAGTFSAITVSLQDSTGASVSGRYSLTIVPAVLTSFQVTPSTQGPIFTKDIFSVTITALDDQGNLFSVNEAVTLTSSNSQIVSSTSITLTNGRGNIRLTANHSGKLTLSASAGSIRSNNVTITVNPSLFVYSWTFFARDDEGNVIASWVYNTADFNKAFKDDNLAALDRDTVLQAWAGSLTVNWYDVGWLFDGKTSIN